METYVIGADGGGTKLEMVLVSHDGRIKGRVVGGSANYQVIGGEKLKREILQTAAALLKENGAVPGQVSCMVLGLAGAGREDCRRDILSLFSDTDFSGKTAVDSDAMAALAGASGKKPGIILISGTGSICFGMKEDGTVIRSGGWGYLLGDEGSGYYIGNTAVIASLKDHDGRGEHTILKRIIEKRFDIDSIDKIIPLIYQNKIERSEIADLAPLVFEAAENKDHIALEIINRTGRELGKLAKAVSDQIDFPDGLVKIALIGGVFSKREMLLAEMRKAMSGDQRKILFSDPEFKPAVGSAFLALEKSGITLDEQILAHIRKSIQ
ncbi:hypothetical protein JXO52_15890 [bacterium]|nr:hypothetical protein [bacterium]